MRTWSESVLSTGLFFHFEGGTQPYEGVEPLRPGYDRGRLRAFLHSGSHHHRAAKPSPKSSFCGLSARCQLLSPKTAEPHFLELALTKVQETGGLATWLLGTAT